MLEVRLHEPARDLVVNECTQIITFQTLSFTITVLIVGNVLYKI